MSERTHSAPSSPAPRTRKLIPVVVGTTGALVLAVVGLQFLRPSPAASQTRPAAKQPAATATVESTAAAEPAQHREVLARVNNQNITWDAVARECMERHAKDVLENIINRQLIYQACRQRGIEVTDDEIKREVLETSKKFNVPPETWYQLLATERGLNPTQYHRDVIWPMLALKKLAGTDVTITEEEMQRAFVRDYGPRVEARMIVVDGNVRQAMEVWNRAKAKPDDFARLASEVSADPNSRALGGQVPPIRRNAALPDTPQAKLEQEAFALQPGEISTLIQFDENKHIILRCERLTKPVVTDIELVRGDLTEQLKNEKIQEAVGKVFADIKAQAQIHNYLTGESTTGAAGGVQQTSATQTPAPVRPAAASVRTGQ